VHAGGEWVEPPSPREPIKTVIPAPRAEHCFPVGFTEKPEFCIGVAACYPTRRQSTGGIMKELLRTLILVIAVAVILTRGAAAQTAIKVGLTGSFSGVWAALGVSMRDGVRVAVTEINQAGGIMGKQIVLAERDDQGSPDIGVRMAGELINQEKVVATLGFVSTAVALAAQPLYEAAEIPVLNNVATGSQIGHQFTPPEHKANYIFQTSANGAVQVEAIVQEAIARLHYHTPAILFETSDYGQAGRDTLKRALAAVNVKFASEQTFDIGQTDMTDQLARAKWVNPDVILVVGMPRELARIADGMGVLEWKLPIMGDWMLSTSVFIDAARYTGEGASMPQTFLQVTDTERRGAFIAGYRRTHRVRRIDCPSAAAQGYDSVFLLKAAIEQAESTNGPDIRAALENLRTPIEGAVTIYDRPFTRIDHEAITASVLVMGIVRGGHVAVAHETDTSGDRAVRVKQ